MESILFAFSEVLQEPNIAIDTAQSLQEVLELIEKRTYQAVIADLRLTGINDLDGLVVIKEIRKRLPNAVILLITAYGGKDVEEMALRVGANYYFEKPVSPNRIKKLLETRNVYAMAMHDAELEKVI